MPPGRPRAARGAELRAGAAGIGLAVAVGLLLASEPWALGLVGAHGVLVTLGYAQQTQGRPACAAVAPS